ncbi:uncharacterized protein EI90DRAFT_2387706 [Cantharellus anzutake]|uniref:uncharacterized protein n=1 Tax=Cantharellus anzutake TaxID=1750568 RepID=UPI0019070C2D|nr:uncharacterized protein EI90DRAFT_2387706 [Cantharellus anzutake]KAF8323518.1 hypothetical protein EI90DRAFT_2387706 [Cantharellus anzutake]
MITNDHLNSGYEHDRQNQENNVPSKPHKPRAPSPPPSTGAYHAPIKVPPSPLPFVCLAHVPSMRQLGAPMSWAEAMSGVLADAEPSISSRPYHSQTHSSGLLPTQQQLRKRRDAPACVRTRALSGDTVTNPSISAIPNNSLKQSPLGQLRGTTVVEDSEKDDPLLATGPPLSPRGTPGSRSATDLDHS